MQHSSRTDEDQAARERADFIVALLGPVNEDAAALVWECVVLAILAHGPGASDADILRDALRTLEGMWGA